MNRRSFLKSGLVITGTALAGCAGNGSQATNSGSGQTASGGSSNKPLITLSFESNSSTYAFIQGLSSFFTKNVSEYEFAAKAASSASSLPRMFAKGDIDIAPFDNVDMAKITHGVPPYDSIKQKFYQTFHMYDLKYVFITGHKDWKTISDIQSGSTISAGTAGGATREAMTHVLQDYVDLQYTEDNVGYTDTPSSLKSGQLDVGAFSFINTGATLPGWMKKGTSQVSMNIIEIPKDVYQKRKGDKNLFLSTVKIPKDVRSKFNFVPNDPVYTTLISFNFIVRSGMDYDQVMTMMKTMYKKRQNLPDYHSMGAFFSDKEYWTTDPFTDVPFHPAAADFYKDKGLWKDSFTRGKEQ